MNSLLVDDRVAQGMEQRAEEEACSGSDYSGERSSSRENDSDVGSIGDAEIHDRVLRDYR